jgi:flagellar protein FliL
MANPKKAEKPAAAAEAPASGGKKKMILLIVMMLVVVGISVGGTVVALKVLSPPPKEGKGDHEEEHKKEEPPKKAIYFPLPSALMVSFAVDGKQRFLQTDITFVTRNDNVVTAIELHQSAIRNALILLIGEKSFAEIQTLEGREAMRKECLEKVQEVLKEEFGDVGIEQLLFTTFVLQ